MQKLLVYLQRTMILDAAPPNGIFQMSNERIATQQDILNCILNGRAQTDPSLVVRNSAKSFTAGAHRGVASALPTDIRAREKATDGPGPQDVTYDSIRQFQQVVELYRGRYIRLSCCLASQALSSFPVK